MYSQHWIDSSSMTRSLRAMLSFAYIAVSVGQPDKTYANLSSDCTSEAAQSELYLHAPRIRTHVPAEQQLPTNLILRYCTDLLTSD
eukprot:COSAG02_NODE_3739_length_6303_cov_12.797228_9_plen_86_part_00